MEYFKAYKIGLLIVNHKSRFKIDRFKYMVYYSYNIFDGYISYVLDIFGWVESLNDSGRTLL